jgi:hypothetical protein
VLELIGERCIFHTDTREFGEHLSASPPSAGNTPLIWP